MVGFKNKLPSRGVLIAIIGLILIAGFVATNVISYQVSKGSLRQAIIDNELPLTSNNIYSEIQRDLLQPVFIASLMANDSFVKEWLLDGERDHTKIVRYLDVIREKYGVFTSFLISDATHNYYHFSGVSKIVSETDPRDDWYFRAREMKEPSKINVDLNQEQGDTLTVFINHQIRDDQGRNIAIIGVGLKLDAVATVVDRYKKVFGRNVYFIDAAGRVKVRSEGASIIEDNIHTAPGIGKIAEAVLAADHGFFEYLRDGETMLVSTRKIPELGWLVLVEQSESNALAAIRQGAITNALVGLGVIVLTILIITYTINLFHARLETMATIDRLTGIGNREVFDISLAQALRRNLRHKKPFSVIMLDIDHFKRVNDTLGHLQGDRVIREISGIVQECVRESDIVCRWGGEELIVLADDCAIDSASNMAEKVRQAIEAAPLAKLPDGSRVTTSAGVTEVRESDNADDILERADQALYQAKQDGRNRVRRG